jgi:putative sugar O-methyltransferase
MEKYKESSLWRGINKDVIPKDSEINLNSFRNANSSLNKRLTSWSPYDKGSYRYFKTLLFNTVLGMPKEFFDLYNSISNTEIGNPVYVNVHKTKVNLEYFFSVQEVMFLRRHIVKLESCVEIGGGYGRLCHAIIEIFPNIKKYTMVDLKPMLEISKKYLKKVLSDENFKKINFVLAKNTDKINHVDIVINVNSFAEMHPDTVHQYLSFISKKSSAFYTKNTIGKYTPDSIGLSGYDIKEYSYALDSGICREVVDIFDSDSMEKIRQRYLINYLPSSNWECIDNDVSYPYTYYHSALYVKGGK